MLERERQTDRQTDRQKERHIYIYNVCVYIIYIREGDRCYIDTHRKTEMSITVRETERDGYWASDKERERER